MQIQATIFFYLLTGCRAEFDLTTNLTADSITNGTQLVGYVQDLSGRGTATLVTSSLLTLVLCVWSALHLIVIAGIYAPEPVVFAAWRQWCSAWLLQQLVEQTLKDTQTGSQPSKCYTEWTMSHSFFACTGGFAFELKSLDQVMLNSPNPKANRPQRLTLTARGMALLARCCYLPSVRKEEIEDKSKANDLAKAIVLVQASWMLIQVVGRLASKLPVTPLEVNTVAHVLCAFLMYLFWWNKPLLPNEPIVLNAEELGPLAAFMYSSSKMSGYVDPEQVKSQTVVKTLFAHLNLYSKTPELETICLRPKVAETTAKPPSTIVTSTSIAAGSLDADLDVVQVLRDPESRLQKAPEACISELQARRQKEQGTAFFERRPRIVVERPGSGNQPSTRDVDRWSLIQQAFRTFPTLCEDRVSMSHRAEDGGPCVHFRAEQLAADHVRNWPSNDLLRSVDGLVLWLWRISAVYVGFCGGLWVALNFAFWEHWMDGRKTWWQNLGLGAVVFLCGLGLVLARTFIVVEAVVSSIRELPASAYRTPEWIDLFPHF
ncbi:hypothetical protein F4820DRAFT_455816 [Hypoxylon rubiginosum]|uniref:Uncharacterized protein n=1 Tax=Hypoxylon rubiginosum TaxID=110542 RepID=A0ACB9ZD30_9PEZI|nr:hypothetical protein F4820DRAFT_455816 [Hypoxylon rubiginosum]